MKKVILLAVAVVMIVSVGLFLVGCGNTPNDRDRENNNANSQHSVVGVWEWVCNCCEEIDTLVIRRDGTFTLCVEEYEYYGSWKMHNGDVIFSFPFDITLSDNGNTLYGEPLNRDSDFGNWNRVSGNQNSIIGVWEDIDYPEMQIEIREDGYVLGFECCCNDYIPIMWRLNNERIYIYNQSLHLRIISNNIIEMNGNRMHRQGD